MFLERPIELRGGAQANDPRLGRVPEFDERSRNYPVRELPAIRKARAPRSYTWRVRQRVNQHITPRCVGYSWTQDVAARPVELPISTELADR